MSPVELINLAEAAQRLGISAGTATRWADRGKLPTITIAGRRLVPVDQLDQIEPKSTKGRKLLLAKQLPPDVLERLRQEWERRQTGAQTAAEALELEQLIIQAAEALGWSREMARFAYADNGNNLDFLR